jgi:hypothetical protein
MYELQQMNCMFVPVKYPMVDVRVVACLDDRGTTIPPQAGEQGTLR